MAIAKKDSNNGGGIGILGLIGVAFVVLKLCGVIHWSWLWVTAPLWGPWALYLFVLGAGALFSLIAELRK